MAVNGDERLNPLRAGFPVCDTVGGLNAAFAIMAALYHRERTGEGQFIDVAMLDSIMPLMGWVAANLLIGKQQPVLMGNDNFTAAPVRHVPARKDGYINIAANKQEQWESVCDVLGVPELKTDPRFQKRDIRKKNRKALTPLLEAKLAGAARPRLGRAAQREGRPDRRDPRASRTRCSSRRSQHRGTLQDRCPWRASATLPLFGLTAKFEKTPGDITAPPPRLSAHTAEVLAGVGVTPEQLAALKSKGIV